VYRTGRSHEHRIHLAAPLLTVMREWRAPALRRSVAKCVGRHAVHDMHNGEQRAVFMYEWQTRALSEDRRRRDARTGPASARAAQRAAVRSEERCSARPTAGSPLVAICRDRQASEHRAWRQEEMTKRAQRAARLPVRTTARNRPAQRLTAPPPRRAAPSPRPWKAPARTAQWSHYQWTPQVV